MSDTTLTSNDQALANAVAFIRQIDGLFETLQIAMASLSSDSGADMTERHPTPHPPLVSTINNEMIGTPLDLKRPPPRKQMLGTYAIRSALGEGAMGTVYEGWDPSAARRVALKTIRRHLLECADSAEVVARFRREAQVSARLAHPNIVAIYDYGEDDGMAFIAMEFVQGRDLNSYVAAHERFSLAAIANIMGQLLDALDYAHRSGVVHRDIKPANLFLRTDGTLKIADFGLARIDTSTLTQTGSVMGTPSFMSPEQFMGQTVDGRSDLFSAGVVLYQLLTGERPFTGAITSIMHKVLKVSPPAPSDLNVHIPLAFDRVVAKALAKRPDQRFQTAAEFKQALVSVSSGAPTMLPSLMAHSPVPASVSEQSRERASA